MKKLYLVFLFLVIAVIIMNVITLYLLLQRPSLPEVQRMIQANQIQSQIVPNIEEAIKAVVANSPTPVKGDPGPAGNSVVGPHGDKGDKGDPGPSIVGPQGLRGELGAPGREIELKQDATTHDLYMRYTGDTAWTLVELINEASKP